MSEIIEIPFIAFHAFIEDYKILEAFGVFVTL